MRKFTSFFIVAIFLGNAVSAQFPLPYCAESYTSAVEPITQVIFANIDQTSSAVVNGSAEHQDFTSEKGYVVPGGTYTITVKGNTNGNFLNLLRLYIDWNNDDILSGPGEIYSLPSITNSTGTDAIVSTLNIVVPANASIGNHRMRVSKKRNTTPNICSTSGFGQSEDYTIEVFSAAPYCNNHYPVVISAITNVSFARIDNTTSATAGATGPTQDFTNISTVVVKDSSYNLSVKGNTNGAVTHYIRAFIDWNNDNDFLDANESYDVGTITNSTGVDAIFSSTAITVPANATAGYTRLRVTKKSVGFALPCDSVNRGQSEDYTIHIVEKIRAVIDDGNAYLQGDYVEVGLNHCGGWGTFGKAPVEYHARSGVGVGIPGNDMLNLGFIADPEKNGWTVGSPNLYNGDYFLPVAPYVGWGITINGFDYGTDRTNSSETVCDNLPGGGIPMPGANIAANINGTKASSTWQGNGSGILLKKITSVKQDKVYFTVQIKLYNTTASTINNIYYGEFVNPDPDYFYNGSTTNVNNSNNIIYQNPADGKSLIQAIGIPGLQSYIGLGSKDCRSKVFRGINIPVEPGGFANDWYVAAAGSDVSLSGGDTGPVNNHCIGISFNVGSILPGDSTTFTYAYILKAEDYNDALDETDPTFTSNAITVPAGGTFTPCANSTNTVKLNDADAYTWTWSPATGLNTTIGKQVDMTVTTTPITYTLTGVALNGCADKTITLYVEPVNISTLTTPASVSKCVGDVPVLLTATGGNFTSAVVFKDDFNNEGNSWNKFNNSTGGAIANAAFTLRPNGYTYSTIPVTFNSNDNSQFYLTNSYAQTGGTATRTILQSEPLGTLNNSSFVVSFYHYLRDPLSSNTALLETSSDGINWIILHSFTSTQGAPNNFIFFSKASPFPVEYIRFRYTESPTSFYWAIDNVKITTSGRRITWAPLAGLYTDAAGTIPYTGTFATSVYANPASNTLYTASANFGACTKTSNTNVVVNSLSTTLAGIVGSTVCQNKLVDTAGSVFNNNTCNPIAKVKPAGASPVTGQINTCVYIDPAVLPFYNAEPYLQRHIDILPATNAATSTARVTLYFTDAEFETYNANNMVWPDLPTVAGGGNTDTRRSNLRITQYHGTPNTNPSQPNNYSMSTGVYINPADNDIFWNGNYWEVSFDVAGFSGFYVHTNLSFPLPVNINYLNGKNQGNTNLLQWKVTCNSTPKVTLVLERSADSRTFNAINRINAAAAECTQSFSHTDNDPLQGINYYRLKVTDADGKITYSNTIALVNAVKGIYITGITPNPINKDGSFKLNITCAKTEKLEMIITDMQGRLVQKQLIAIAAGNNAVTILVPELVAGTYTIGCTNLAGDKTKPVMFIKP
ncbi:MAG: GEVED domain-containing protein [Ferruginibacter sp.]